MAFNANTTWFNISMQGNFSVYAFFGTEEVCKPYEFDIELVSPSRNEPIAELLGTKACLSITDRSGGTRLVHGLIAAMEQRHAANTFTHYYCKLVPRLYFLDQIRDHRIFQNLSVPEIIQKILHEQGFTDSEVKFSLFYEYEPREYCVQYSETCLHFISRLCEEEGIYFYFEHTENEHTLCFCDRESGPAISGESNIRYYPGDGQTPDAAIISNATYRHSINSNAASYREWNFQKPRLNLEVKSSGEGPAPPGMLLEQYRYPHIYELQAPGDRYVKLQTMRQLTYKERLDVESDVSRYLPASTFSIHEHPRSDVNAQWWIVAVRHKGEQPGVLQHEAPDGRGLTYHSAVTAIPSMTRFIPQVEHPKYRIDGLQSAIVTGPEGEEIYTDQYGRVKVQFHWDRLGQHDERTTCWVRVADTLAGENFGSVRIPRIGQEVMIEFMESDPDRPVITGRVYNTLKMPPWKLPEQKTLSGLQSREFHGGQRNQLVFDDTQGQVQAQISSDHGLSQLNLGYITRVNHGEGRKDFRGEGFELRTDGWGVVRAAKGLVLTTEEKKNAQEHHKDITVSVSLLGDGVALHDETTKQATTHKTIEYTEHEALCDSLKKQHKALQGSGEKHEEITEPHLLLFSPAGVAVNTPHSLHLETGEHTAITSAGHTSLVTGKNFMASALDAVRIFAHKMGIRLFSGQGKVEIQAQDDDIDLIAKKVLRLISTQERIEIAAAKEICLNADGSYIKLGRYGIECGTMGKYVVRTSDYSIQGPDSRSGVLPDLPAGASKFNEEYIIKSQITDEPLANMRYELRLASGEVISGVTGEDGKIPLQKSLSPDNYTLYVLGPKD